MVFRWHGRRRGRAEPVPRSLGAAYEGKGMHFPLQPGCKVPIISPLTTDWAMPRRQPNRRIPARTFPSPTRRPPRPLPASVPFLALDSPGTRFFSYVWPPKGRGTTRRPLRPSAHKTGRTAGKGPEPTPYYICRTKQTTQQKHLCYISIAITWKAHVPK